MNYPTHKKTGNSVCVIPSSVLSSGNTEDFSYNVEHLLHMLTTKDPLFIFFA